MSTHSLIPFIIFTISYQPSKGKAVETWRYSLLDGLPIEGEQSQFKYPSDLILLVDDKKVVQRMLAILKSLLL